jgi:prepilin-type N-terminal cleavage/methylation domain-containing protein
MALSRRGFTFVELLVAATMIAILFVGLAGHLRGGITVWQRATTTTQALQQERVAVQRLARDLAHAFVYAASADAYGSSPKLPAPELSAGRLRWYTVEPSGPARRGQARLVTYTCERLQSRTGLWRSSQTLAQARDDAAAPELVLPDCDGMMVSFPYLPEEPSQPLRWLPGWDMGSSQDLPRFFELELRREAASKPPIRLTLALPAGLLKPAQEAGP